MGPAQLLSDPVTCREVVELVTEYLERALSSADEQRFEHHIDECAECAIYIDQVITTMRMLRALSRNPAALRGTEPA